jgi:hypothetical protein
MKLFIIKLFHITSKDIPSSVDKRLEQIVYDEVKLKIDSILTSAVNESLNYRVSDYSTPTTSKQDKNIEYEPDTNMEMAQKSVEDKMSKILDEVVNKEREISDQDFLIRNPKILEHP